MSVTINTVFVSGRLGQDPELRYATSGTPIATFSIAFRETWTKDEQKHEKAHWFDVVSFGKTAELVKKYLAKGADVLIEGSLQFDTWDDKKTGQKRKAVKIRALRVHFLSKPQGQQEKEQSDGPTGPNELGVDVPDDELPF